MAAPNVDYTWSKSAGMDTAPASLLFLKATVAERPKIRGRLVAGVLLTISMTCAYCDDFVAW